jgi:hypothetical protein
VFLVGLIFPFLLSLSLYLLGFLLSSHASTTPAPGWKTGSVIKTNFVDPCLTQVDGIWHAFGVANGDPAGINIQLASSTDFSNWTLYTGYDALPVLGSWANKTGHVWSLDVNQRVSTILYHNDAAH